MHGFGGEYPADHTKTQVLTFFGKKWQKIRCKRFHRKIFFALFCEFVYNSLPKIVVERYLY